MRPRTAFTIKEVLLALVVLLVACAILVPISLGTRRKLSIAEDVRRMRELYVGLSTYQSDVDAALAPDLSKVRPYVRSDASFLSTSDPFRSSSATRFPVDSGMPHWRVESPVRISFSYLYAFVGAGKTHARPWTQAQFDVGLGILADEWQGSVTAGTDFEATVSGLVYRVNADGSVTKRDRNGPKPLGDPKDLFFGR